jgi:hypothetical protein
MDPDANRVKYQLAPVQFSRLTKRGILLGLSVPQLSPCLLGCSPWSLGCTQRACPAWRG